MQFRHVVVAVSGVLLRNGPYRILQGEGDLPAEPVGLQAAGLDHRIGLPEDPGDQESPLPMETVGRDGLPSREGEVVERHHLRSRPCRDVESAPVLQYLPCLSHPAPLPEPHYPGTGITDLSEDRFQRIRVSGRGKRIVAVEVRFDRNGLPVEGRKTDLAPERPDGVIAIRRIDNVDQGCCRGSHASEVPRHPI